MRRFNSEAGPGTSQASKINLFARMVNVYKLTLLTIFVNTTTKDN